ncbi:MAG TPA: cytochrome C [Candidatus Methylomirabilis sp.]|jgi:hypothetical protein|nr:cytochrome C [Candidatus Methylomirabilis sp.]
MAEVTATPAHARPAAKKPRRPSPVEDKVHCWPYLVKSEFICSILLTALLMVWSIALDAPMEDPSNPAQTPNPSKAPWYFLGLQEMLVYFDPWMAGVVLPTFIIIGLMVIPYVDINPKGNGYFTFRERPFAISVYLFGFLVLWVALVVLGVFFRGPGWNLFWPWEKWDPHKVVALTNVDLPYWWPFKWMGNPKIHDLPLLGRVFAGTALGQVELLGLVLTILYYALIPAAWIWQGKRSAALQELGPVRYGIVAFLFLTMVSLPVKMVMRIFFNIKYFWVTPWFNI